jgi:hypothetical protein
VNLSLNILLLSWNGSHRADEQLVRERVYVLRERAELVEVERLRKRHKLTLNNYNRKFLAAFDSEPEKLRKELSKIEMEVGDLVRAGEYQGFTTATFNMDLNEILRHDGGIETKDSLTLKI